MKYKVFTIISVCVLIVAGCSTLITSKMIARALYIKTHTILVISSVLTLIALICIVIHATLLLQEYVNK